MTPQERQLIEELFDRLASLERQPRDADAERAIREGLARAPNAAYALVQTVLVQDEALRRADAHIEELERAAGGGERQQGGFLDSLRDAMFGGEQKRGSGSVPSVRPGDYDRRDERFSGDRPDDRWNSGRAMGVPPGYAQGQGGPGGGPYGGGPAGPFGGGPAGPAGGSFGGGGSFLGTAAAAAAGVIGGSLLLNSIKGMMGPAHAGQGALDPGAGGGDRSPWGGGSGAGDSDLARQAGTEDIGGRRTSAFDEPGRDSGRDRDQGYDRDAGHDQDEPDYDMDGDDFDGGTEDV
jgi:hypothetical protein